MYEFIDGKLVDANPHKAVVNVGGVGYKIGITPSVYAKLPPSGAEVHFFISFVVREDAQILYGFLHREERDFFEKLTLVSGIGPKTALALLGCMELADLQAAIVQGNVTLLSKAPGIGKKTAERAIVELRDKIKNDKTMSLASIGGHPGAGVMADAISALVHLGYHPFQAQKVVKKVFESQEKPPELAKLITLSLKLI